MEKKKQNKIKELNLAFNLVRSWQPSHYKQKTKLQICYFPSFPTLSREPNRLYTTIQFRIKSMKTNKHRDLPSI